VTCRGCLTDKAEADFYLRDAAAPEKGRRARCKTCVSTKGRVASPAEKAAKAHARREWRIANPEAARRAYLAAYGVTPEWYAETLEAQAGACAICRGACKTGDNFAVDHDHRCCPALPLCGKCSRGLLCRSCNLGIGNLADDVDRVLAAAHYLQGWTR